MNVHHVKITWTPKCGKCRQPFQEPEHEVAVNIATGRLMHADCLEQTEALPLGEYVRLLAQEAIDARAAVRELQKPAVLHIDLETLEQLPEDEAVSVVVYPESEEKLKEEAPDEQPHFEYSGDDHNTLAEPDSVLADTNPVGETVTHGIPKNEAPGDVVGDSAGEPSDANSSNPPHPGGSGKDDGRHPGDNVPSGDREAAKDDGEQKSPAPVDETEKEIDALLEED